MKTLFSTCCNVPIETRDPEQESMDQQIGIEHKNDFGIYDCPECGRECEANLEQLL